MQDRIRKSVGERIKYLRKKHGISQEEMAKKLFVSCSSTIAKYELNKRVPPMHIVLGYSRIFNVSTDWILKGD